MLDQATRGGGVTTMPGSALSLSMTYLLVHGLPLEFVFRRFEELLEMSREVAFTVMSFFVVDVLALSA